MINWKVRIKNKNFWIALIPAVLLLVQVIAAVFGYTLDLGELGDKLLAVVNALFAVLTILGIVTDPTTAGIGDSKQALTYETPKKEDAVYHTAYTMKTNPTQCFTKKNEFGFALFGGPGGIRTLDLSDANRTLSQLSYRPIGSADQRLNCYTIKTRNSQP